MTDVPRRSYPLVVPPPGGFEDAVKQGRRIRRRRLGGSTGAALALAGVVAYATMGGPAGTSGLQPTDRNPIVRDTPAPGGPESPAPTTSPSTPTSPSGGGTVPGHQPGTSGPTAGVPTPTGGVPSVPAPTGAPRPYAARGAVGQTDAGPGTSTPCLPTEGNEWCAQAFANADATRYKLVYLLCRAVDAGTGYVEFTREQVDFAVTDTRGKTIWTYSAGQQAKPAAPTTAIEAGTCVEFYTYWNGYDDWGGTPTNTGQYRLLAQSRGTSDDGPLPTAERTFTYDG